MAKNQYHEYLKRVPLFADLDKRELDHVSQAATDLELEPGNVLMREGSMANEMIIVVEGTLEVTRDGEHIADIDAGGFAMSRETCEMSSGTYVRGAQSAPYIARQTGSNTYTSPSLGDEPPAWVEPWPSPVAAEVTRRCESM